MASEKDSNSSGISAKSAEIHTSASESASAVVSSDSSNENHDAEKGAESRDSGDAVLTPVSEVVEVPLSKKQLIILCFTLAIAVMIMSIDETVIVTAIPKITDEFKTISDVGVSKLAALLSLVIY